jgi:transcriptional regulator with XRE-family HTH domain
VSIPFPSFCDIIFNEGEVFVVSSVGESIREARKKAKMTQEELAKKTNLSRSHIGAIETNRYNPSLSTLKLIANAVNVDVPQLVGGLLGDISDPSHPWNKHISQQAKSDVVWNPPPEFFTDPETGKLIEAMNISDTHKRIILASKDLSPEELNRIADLMETMAESHRKD